MSPAFLQNFKSIWKNVSCSSSNTKRVYIMLVLKTMKMKKMNLASCLIDTKLEQLYRVRQKFTPYSSYHKNTLEF